MPSRLISWLKRGAFNVLVSLDQLGNTIAGGDPDETISSRAGKNNGKARWATWLCKLLNFLDPGHCDKAIEPDEGKNQL